MMTCRARPTRWVVLTEKRNASQPETHKKRGQKPGRPEGGGGIPAAMMRGPARDSIFHVHNLGNEGGLESLQRPFNGPARA